MHDARVSRRFFVAMALLACLGCSRSRESDAENLAAADSLTTEAGADTSRAGDRRGGTRTEEAIPVEIAVLETGRIESVIRATANLEAENAVAVVAEASRRVTELLVEEGQVVRKGQVLLRLQSDEQQSAVLRTETELAQAQREFDRQSSLHQRDLTTEQALQDARDELDRRKLAYEDAKRELSYTEVKAPIAGTITARMVSVGHQVTVGQELFNLVDFESLVARIYVPEQNLRDLHVGQPVRLTASAVRREPYQCSVKRVSPVVDPRTGTIKVTVGVGGQPGLRPGLFADVELVTAVQEEAVLLPKRALIYDNDQVFAFRLLPARRVQRTLVLPALTDKDHVMPVDGFAAGDTVIVAGQTGLKDNALVRLPDDPEPAAAASDGKGKAKDARGSESR